MAYLQINRLIHSCNSHETRNEKSTYMYRKKKYKIQSLKRFYLFDICFGRSNFSEEKTSIENLCRMFAGNWSTNAPIMDVIRIKNWDRLRGIDARYCLHSLFCFFHVCWGYICINGSRGCGILNFCIRSSVYIKSRLQGLILKIYSPLSVFRDDTKQIEIYKSIEYSKCFSFP